MTLKTILKNHGITIFQLAKALDVSISQIYNWNRNGISKHNPHFRELKEILPEIQPKEERLTKQGKEDKRYNSGRKKKKLILTDTDLKDYKEPEHKSEIFPKIYMSKKPH